MPEASVEEDGDLQPRKSEIACRALHTRDRVVDAIAEPAGMELRADSAFEEVVFARGALHSAANRFGDLQG